MYKGKPNKTQLNKYKEQLEQQEKQLQEMNDYIQQNKLDVSITTNNNKSSYYVEIANQIIYRVSTHHLPSGNYDGNYRDYKGYLNSGKQIKEIITNSRANIEKHIGEILKKEGK